MKEICNSKENRESIECAACGKDHSEFVAVCGCCGVRQRANLNRPSTCLRCGKTLDTTGAARDET